MSMFNDLHKYKSPVIKQVNTHIHIAYYYPEKKYVDLKSIISIYNTKTNSNIQLYSDTLVNICDIFITSMLSNLNNIKLPKTNKKVSKRIKK